MPVAARIQVTGARELRAALREADRELSAEQLKETNLKAAQVVEEEAQRTVPIVSGTLASTIRAAGQQAKAVVRAGKAAVPYAGPIHFGWARHNIEPNPFLYEATDRRADEVIRVYEKQVQQIVEKVGASTP